MHLLTLISFIKPIVLDLEALGQNISCNIGDIPCDICLPRWPGGSLDGVRELLPPSMIDSLMDKKGFSDFFGSEINKIIWGVHHALLGPHIRVVLLWVYLPNSNIPICTTTKNIDNAFLHWHNTLIDWLELSTEQDLGSHGPVPSRAVDALISDWIHESQGGERSRISVKLPTNQISETLSWIEGRWPRTGTSVTLHVWKNAIRNASARVSVPEELILFRDSRAVFTRQRYRIAVIDAAAAVELILNKLVQAQLAISKNPTWERNYQRQLTLGGLVNLAHQMGIVLPSEIRDELVIPRNKAIHENAQPSREVAIKAIGIAKSVIDKYVLINAT